MLRKLNKGTLLPNRKEKPLVQRNVLRRLMGLTQPNGNRVLQSSDALISLEPIYEYLSEKGYRAEMEAVLIEGVAVQFLPVYNPLNEEAVEDAVEFDYEGVTVRVMRAEHLVAIMLQTGRSKDFVRIARFVESDVLDNKALMDILAHHKLKQKWNALGAIHRRLSK